MLDLTFPTARRADAPTRRARATLWLLPLLAIAGCERGSQLRDTGTDAAPPGADAVSDMGVDVQMGVDAAVLDGADASPGDAPTLDDGVLDAVLDAPGPDVGDIGADVAALDVTPKGDAASADDAADVPEDAGPLFTDAGCGARYDVYEPEPGVHYPADAGLTWATNPPNSGPHYDLWAVWGVHATPVPRGNYVHNLEHGGVVVLYRCDGDCSALRAQLTTLVNALPPEPGCVALGMGVARRVVLTEDPLLDAPVGATAWGWTYHADCVDAPSLTAFILARTGHGPEDTCFEGYVP